MTWTDWDSAITALTAWREARGEGQVGMRAVMHVIVNRSVVRNLTPAQVCCQTWQFSSMTAPGDGMLIQWPLLASPQFQECLAMVEDVLNGTLADTTGGATFYFNPAVVTPKWVGEMTKTCDIGHHAFYKPTEHSSSCAR